MEILCGGCGERLEVDDALAGCEVQCEYCEHIIRVPALDDEPAPPPARTAPEDAPPRKQPEDDFLAKARLALKNKLLVTCDECSQRLTVEQRLAGKLVQCPACGQMIRIPEPAGPFPELREPAEPAEPDRPAEPAEPAAVQAYQEAETWQGLDEADAHEQALGAQPASRALQEALAARPRAARPVVRRGLPRRSNQTTMVLLIGLGVAAVFLVGLALLNLVENGQGPEVGSGQQASPAPEPDARETEPDMSQQVGVLPLPDPGGLTNPTPKPPDHNGGEPLVVPAETNSAGGKGKCTVVRAEMRALAAGGAVPAPVGGSFLQVAVRLSAGEDEPLRLDTAAGDVVLTTPAGKFPALGVPAKGALLPTVAENRKMTIPPTAGRRTGFVFCVPADTTRGTLRIAGLPPVEVARIGKLPSPAAADLAGSYKETSRHLKVGFADPVMDQFRASSRHRLVITPAKDRFRILAPPTGLSGECRFASEGVYTARLGLGDKAIPCTLRLLGGGRQLVLYLAGGPYHQVVYERQ